jgi:glutamate dehydrogenase/leucine dehydrogenase
MSQGQACAQVEVTLEEVSHEHTQASKVLCAPVDIASPNAWGGVIHPALVSQLQVCANA